MEDAFMRVVVRERLAEAEALTAAAAARRAARVWLTRAAPVDSRGTSAVVSTDMRVAGARALELAGLVAAAAAVVGVLATLCR